MKSNIFLSLVGFFLAAHLQAQGCTNLTDLARALENVQEILLDDASSDDYKSLNKYEFVATKLGIVGRGGSHSLRAVISKLCQSLKYPGMLAAYFGCIEFTKEDVFPFNVGPLGAFMFGALGSTATYFTFDSLGQYLDTSGKSAAKLQDFIVNWPSYKTGTPDEFSALFEGLHMEYLNNGQAITISDVLAEEILKKIAMAYINSLVPEATA